MKRITHTTRLIVLAVGLAAAVAGGITAGLLGGAAASTVLGSQGGASGMPASVRVAASRAALAKTTRPAPGSTLVAEGREKIVPLYRRPGQQAYLRLGPLPDSYGTAPVFRVLRRDGAWLHVSLPTRPDHATAWIRVRSVYLRSTDYRLVVDPSRHQLRLYQGRDQLLASPIAVGKSLTPTPRGTYFIAYALRTGDPGGPFGPYAFGLSAYSNVLTNFAGGDGEIGLHGTNEPRLLGRSVSHGCIRVANRVISRLANLIPLGTPVTIQPRQTRRNKTWSD
ncbi:MAG: L,D-transpeptidase [Gaiellaceae bacterium]